MRKVMRWRYYCDHCKRSGGSGGHMAKHEKGCTNNPARVCGLCLHSSNEQASIEALKAAWATSFKALRELAGECPACILAAMRQGPGPDGGAGFWSDSDERFEGLRDWDFRAELKAFWEEENSMRDDGRGY